MAIEFREFQRKMCNFFTDVENSEKIDEILTSHGFQKTENPNIMVHTYEATPHTGILLSIKNVTHLTFLDLFIANDPKNIYTSLIKKIAKENPELKPVYYRGPCPYALPRRLR